ncbi:MAG: TlpA disulfide reductase family protein [Pseudomonadota bacterium]
MSASEKRKNTTSPVTYAVAIAVALFAGFGTVYWLSTPSDNRSEGSAAQDTASESGASIASGIGAGPLKGLNTGAMTAFVIRPEPAVLPEFAFEKPGGGEISSADLKGKVVLLNIWATWCVPCREEMPQLNALEAELGSDGFEVVALNIDKGGPDKAVKFLEETGATDLKAYYDPSGKLFAKFKAVGMPTTLLIDTEGKEMGRLVGPADWSSPEAKAIVEAAIAAADGNTP